MSAILESPEVRQRVWRLLVEECHRLDEFNANSRRTEPIRGIVVEKTMRSPPHCAIARRLNDRITPILPAGFVVRRADPLTRRDSEPEPDIAVVCGSAADSFTARPTTAKLVIEVAVSSAALARANAFLSAEAGVKEYWIVLAPERRVEVYRQPGAGRYQEMKIPGPDETLECLSVPTPRIRLADLLP
jgi:Uma2 family endonuclease